MTLTYRSRSGDPSARVVCLVSLLLSAGCTSLAGLDKDYRLVPGAGGVGGSGAEGGTAGAGGDAAVSGTGGDGGSATGGSSGTDAGAGGTSGTGASGGSSGVEDCTNTTDDDGDQKVDCFDSDCSDASECAGKCADAVTLGCNVARTGQSSGAAGATQRIAPPDYACAPGARPGPEYAYRIAGTAGDTVFVEIYGLDADLGLFAVEVAEGAQCEAAQSCAGFGDAFSGSEPEAAAFTRAVGNDYFVVVDGPAAGGYSIVAQCSSNSTCRPVRGIQAGQSISASNAADSAPNVTDNQSVYSCTAGLHAAPEVAYMFTPTVAGTYEITLSGLSGNLDLFVVGAPDCDTQCLSPSSVSANASSQIERITLVAEANTSYYIVVDGYVISSFTLTVTQL